VKRGGERDGQLSQGVRLVHFSGSASTHKKIGDKRRSVFPAVSHEEVGREDAGPKRGSKSDSILFVTPRAHQNRKQPGRGEE